MAKLFLNSKKVLVKIYNGSKYDASSEKYLECSYDDCTGFEVVTGAEAEEIEAHIDDSDYLDDYHEYLILFFGDGTDAIFRNSRTDLFTIA